MHVYNYVGPNNVFMSQIPLSVKIYINRLVASIFRNNNYVYVVLQSVNSLYQEIKTNLNPVRLCLRSLHQV